MKHQVEHDQPQQMIGQLHEQDEKSTSCVAKCMVQPQGSSEIPLVKSTWLYSEDRRCYHHLTPHRTKILYYNITMCGRTANVMIRSKVRPKSISLNGFTELRAAGTNH